MSYYARITGTGSYLHPTALSNDDLVARGVDTSDAWIVERTGIRSRHIADENQTASVLALEASLRAIEAAGIPVEKIDLVILATSTPDFVFPSTACLLQAKLGLRGAAAFDVQAVCSGFVYALTIAEKFIASGSHRCALVVGAEVFSRILDWNDRSTCVLFGDGAGAAIVEASDAPGILSSAIHADGSYHSILEVPGNVCGGRIVGSPFLKMDGQAVFKFAVKVLAEVAHEALDRARVPPADIDWLVPHQANIRIIQGTARKLGLPMDKVITTVERHGNTSAASIPLALDAGVREGRIRRGDTLLLEGVGGGFTWGAVVLEF
jgi:3-oxoacyl-[acyl-carrier-protein] synthase-3